MPIDFTTTNEQNHLGSEYVSNNQAIEEMIDQLTVIKLINQSSDEQPTKEPDLFSSLHNSIEVLPRHFLHFLVEKSFKFQTNPV
jgi:hypothetical protein